MLSLNTNEIPGELAPQSNGKTLLGQRSTFKRHMTLISSKPEPAIWSCHTGQQLACFDSCQIDHLTNIKCKVKWAICIIMLGTITVVIFSHVKIMCYFHF